MKAKRDLQEQIFEACGEQWDIPDQIGKGGTTTKGNTTRKILHEKRQIVIAMMPESYQSAISKYEQ